MNLSETYATMSDVAATCLEINNNQYLPQQVIGENENERIHEFCDTDLEDTLRVVRKRTIMDDNDNEICKQNAANGSTISCPSLTDTDDESTGNDIGVAIFDNESDWINTDTCQRKNPDNSLLFQNLTYRTAALVVFFVSVMCFGISYDAEGVFDDRAAIWENPDVSPDTPWQNVFRNDFWGKDMKSNHSHKSYRPLTILTFRLCYYFGGGFNRVWFHVPNILLHAAISALLLRVFSILFGGYRVNLDTNQVEYPAPKSSFLCAVLFAVHPIHTECAAGVVGRADLLCALLFILSFLMYVKSCAKELHEVDDALIIYTPTVFSVWWMLGSMFLCFLSVFCKEQGLTVLGICSAYDIIQVCRLDPTQILRERKNSPSAVCYGKEGERLAQCNGHVTKQLKTSTNRRWVSSLVKRHLFLLATGLFTMWLRMRVMGQHPPHFEVFDNPHSYFGGPFERLLNYNYLYSLNAWLLVHPWWLCCDWSMGCIPVIRSLRDPRVLVGVAFWLVLGSLLVLCFKRPLTSEKRTLTVALAFIIVPFLPATNLFFRVGFVIAERILYLSSIGYCMVMVLGLRRICGRYSKNITVSMTIRVGVVFLLLVYAVRSIQRTTDWRSDLDLLKASEKVCPLNAKIHYNMGVHLHDSGSVIKAMERYMEAIRLNPLYTSAYHNIGMLLNKNGEYEEAEYYFNRVIEIEPEYAQAWANIAVSKEKLEKYQEAEQCYLTALRLKPHYPKCLLNMGRMYLAKNKDHNKAMELWWKAIGMNRKDPAGWYNIAVILHNLGRYHEGINILKRALSFNPGVEKLLFLLADSYKRAGDWSECEKAYLEALQYHPLELDLNFQLGVLYQEWKKYNLAEKYYRKCLNISPNAPHVVKKLGTLPFQT